MNQWGQELVQELNDGSSFSIDGSVVLWLLHLANSLKSLKKKLLESGSVWSGCLVSVILYICWTAGCGC